jgi:hypothetical protein
MRENEVKHLIGEIHWPEFCVWMGGQTVGMYSDGETDYYAADVHAFKRKLDSGYDRQEDPLAWD